MHGMEMPASAVGRHTHPNRADDHPWVRKPAAYPPLSFQRFSTVGARAASSLEGDERRVFSKHMLGKAVANVQLPTLSRGPAGAASESVLVGNGLFRTERTVVNFVLVHYIESNHPYDEMLFNNGASLKLTEDCTGGGSPPQAVEPVFHQSTEPPEAGRCTLLRSFSPPTALAPRPATNVSLSACRSRHDATRQRRAIAEN